MHKVNFEKTLLRKQILSSHENQAFFSLTLKPKIQ